MVVFPLTKNDLNRGWSRLNFEAGWNLEKLKLWQWSMNKLKKESKEKDPLHQAHCFWIVPFGLFWGEALSLEKQLLSCYWFQLHCWKGRFVSAGGTGLPTALPFPLTPLPEHAPVDEALVSRERQDSETWCVGRVPGSQHTLLVTSWHWTESPAWGRAAGDILALVRVPSVGTTVLVELLVCRAVEPAERKSCCFSNPQPVVKSEFTCGSGVFQP